MTPPTPHSTRSRSRRTLAAAAAMTGFLLAAQPLTASAASTDEAKMTTSNDWLDVSVTGSDDSTRLFTAGVPGGGTMLTFFQMPSGDGATPKARELTLTVEGEAVAAGAASLKDGAMVPSADADLEQTQADGETTVTVEATNTSQTVFLLPEQAPRAADPDDQGWVSMVWGQLLDKIGLGGDEDSSAEETTDDEADAESGEDSTPEPSPSSTANSSTSTSSATSTSSDGAEDQAQSKDEDAESVPTATATTSPSSSTTSPGADGDDDTEAAEGGEMCVVTPSTSAVDEGGQAEDYAVSDGPTAAPTFSEEVRQKAAAAASECGGDDSDDSDDDSTESTESSGSSSGITRADVADGDWLSGASGNPDGIAKLRGAEAEVATTWANGGTNGIDVPQLQDGGEYSQANWNKSLIVSVSPFEEGGSWAKAAAGDYDANWKKQLTNIKNGWGERDGELFVSLAWELNGNWFAWSVTAGETDDMRAAWSRYRKLQKEILPQALLTLTMNRESNGYDGNSADLIVKGDLDVYGVDYYNHYPYAATTAEFEAGLNERDGGGGPKGLEAHRQEAEDAGVPMALPEWNGSAKNGDSPDFIEGMYEEFAQHAGPGAGQVVAETIFEIDKDDNNWALLGDTRMPKSAAAYAEAFSDVG
ncbi:glycoside hydrolase family 26 protein [Kineococcus sp. SYSU DK003]|uniref:hypothetical protein n=1 Tax=Kineococcus sp. SYSU DK003 TaxID=3383124 RepID=UPI003D7CC2B5